MKTLCALGVVTIAVQCSGRQMMWAVGSREKETEKLGTAAAVSPVIDSKGEMWWHEIAQVPSAAGSALAGLRWSQR